MLILSSPVFIGTHVYWTLSQLGLLDPLPRKINILKTLPERVFICSECKLDAEVREITKRFLAKFYPVGVIKTNIRFRISKFNGIKTFDPPKFPVVQ